MNNRINQVLFALFFVIISTVATGQNIDFTKSNFGVRVGLELDVTNIGFTAETPLADDFGEASINLSSAGDKVTFLYKQYTDLELDDLTNLRYYYGIGPTVLFTDDNILYGGEVSVGLDYSFDDIPLIVGFEIKPTYFFGDALYFAQFAFFGKFDLAQHKGK